MNKILRICSGGKYHVLEGESAEHAYSLFRDADPEGKVVLNWGSERFVFFVRHISLLQTNWNPE